MADATRWRCLGVAALGAPLVMVLVHPNAGLVFFIIAAIVIGVQPYDD